MADGTKRRLAAIVSADVVGYSRLMGADETGTLSALRAHRSELIDPLIAKHGGRIVKTMGDGLLLEFPSVVEATQCSLEFQRGMATRNEGVESNLQIVFRIGVNLGDIIIEGEDIFGDGVNIAARLQNLAEPGTICISASVYDQITGKIECDCTDLGEKALKNIERPIRAFSLVGSFPNGTKRIPMPTKTSRSGEGIDLRNFERPSIIVMPFKDLGGADQDSLADGIRLSLHSVLIKLSGLFLLHTAAVEKFRGQDYSPINVGDEIDVRYVIEGAVQRSGDRVRVTIEMTDTSAQQLKMSKRYDRVVDDIFDLQDEIALEIVKALDTEFRVGDPASHLVLEITNPLAREYFHRSISHLYKGTQIDNTTARQLAEKLVEIEPDLSFALAFIALTHWRDAKLGWSEDIPASLDKAEAFAQRTIELGDPDGLGNTIMGHLMLLKRRHEDALAASTLALERRPSCPLSNGLLAEVLQYAGEPEKAVLRMKEALQLSRILPPWMINVLASALRDNNELEESIDVANEALRLAPGGLDSLVTLCCDYSLSSLPNEAEIVAQKIVQADPSFSISRYTEGLPYKEQAPLQRLIEGLSLAGLPD